ncbi:MAG TPA: hypothetical protein VJR89_13070 [Polyangiales bacterium]|nr:hypothetical protein [Polyangiales bacterium]
MIEKSDEQPESEETPRKAYVAPRIEESGKFEQLKLVCGQTAAIEKPGCIGDLTS